MYQKIKEINFSRLRNEAHYEFLFVVYALLENFPEVRHVVELLLDKFIEVLDLEKRLLDAARTSAYTQQIADADHRVDCAISGIKGVVKANLNSFDKSIAEAARVLYLRLKELGKIQRKAYEEESAAVQVLLSELTGKLAPQVELITGLKEWVSELAMAEAEFTSLYMNRNVEIADKPQERMPDVRRQIQEIYHQMLILITAAVMTEEREEYNEFIVQLNAQIKYFNEHNHHHTRKDIATGDHCIIDPIETQTYTGKGITPIPQVYYHEEGKPDIELGFAVDFFVTYKNNIDVGMAKCIVHGKGGYKGQMTVTFNIS
jgi:DNA gyrase/topoisomerase IV subunit A